MFFTRFRTFVGFTPLLSTLTPMQWCQWHSVRLDYFYLLSQETCTQACTALDCTPLHVREFNQAEDPIIVHEWPQHSVCRGQIRRPDERTRPPAMWERLAPTVSMVLEGVFKRRTSAWVYHTSTVQTWIWGRFHILLNCHRRHSLDQTCSFFNAAEVHEHLVDLINIMHPIKVSQESSTPRNQRFNFILGTPPRGFTKT
jgi:hypothetical protein